MHIGLVIAVLGVSLWKGDWRHLNRYGLSIFYVISANLLYFFLCKDYLLWNNVPDFFPRSQAGVDLLYTFIVLPGLILIYLSNYPEWTSIGKRALYIIYWVCGTFLLFLPFVITGRLVYQYGYQLWMDFFFYIVMYSLTLLHQSRRWLTYILSALFISFLLWYFKVPLQ